MQKCSKNRFTWCSLFRSLSLAVLFAAALGVGIGLLFAQSALIINGWNPQLEYQKQSEIVRKVIAETTDPNAKASIDETVYDFGIKDLKEKGSHDFTIKNVGTAPLILEVNRTTCSCTGIDLSKHRLSPGDATIATVHYNAERATSGAFDQGGIIVTNDPENREIYLGIKGIFTAPIVASPSAVVLSNVPSLEKRTGKTRLFGFEKKKPGEEGLVIRNFTWQDKEHFDFQFSPSELTEAEQNDSLLKNATAVYDVEITVKPGLAVGLFDHRFKMETNYASEPSFEIIARGQVTGTGISISGSGYNKDSGIALLGATEVGKRLSKDLMIHFVGTAATNAKLNLKEATPEWMRVTITEPKGVSSGRKIYTVRIDIPADAPVCQFMGGDERSIATVLLETGLTDTPVLKIPVQFAVTN